MEFGTTPTQRQAPTAKNVGLSASGSVVSTFIPVPTRPLKLDYILVENIRALLLARNLDQGDMAFAVGHSNAWISKILSGDRKMSLTDVDKVAAFFGLTGSQPAVSRH